MIKDHSSYSRLQLNLRESKTKSLVDGVNNPAENVDGSFLGTRVYHLVLIYVRLSLCSLDARQSNSLIHKLAAEFEIIHRINICDCPLFCKCYFRMKTESLQ